MKLNTILTELVDIANTLDNRKLTDIGADIDAAIFILSSGDSQPINKSLASLVKEQFASLDRSEMSMEDLEEIAITSADSISVLMDRVVELDPKLTVAILSSLVQSLKSILEPGTTISASYLDKGAELLAEAERKLAYNESRGIGYKVSVLRAALEQYNG